MIFRITASRVLLAVAVLLAAALLSPAQDKGELPPPAAASDAWLQPFLSKPGIDLVLVVGDLEKSVKFYADGIGMKPVGEAKKLSDGATVRELQWGMDEIPNKQVFERLDRNKDGVIIRDEVASLGGAGQARSGPPHRVSSRSRASRPKAARCCSTAGRGRRLKRQPARPNCSSRYSSRASPMCQSRCKASESWT